MLNTGIISIQHWQDSPSSESCSINYFLNVGCNTDKRDKFSPTLPIICWIFSSAQSTKSTSSFCAKSNRIEIGINSAIDKYWLFLGLWKRANYSSYSILPLKLCMGWARKSACLFLNIKVICSRQISLFWTILSRLATYQRCSSVAAFVRALSTFSNILDLSSP